MPARQWHNRSFPCPPPTPCAPCRTTPIRPDRTTMARPSPRRCLKTTPSACSATTSSRRPRRARAIRRPGISALTTPSGRRALLSDRLRPAVHDLSTGRSGRASPPPRRRDRQAHRRPARRRLRASAPRHPHPGRVRPRQRAARPGARRPTRGTRPRLVHLDHGAPGRAAPPLPPARRSHPGTFAPVRASRCRCPGCPCSSPSLPGPGTAPPPSGPGDDDEQILQDLFAEVEEAGRDGLEPFGGSTQGVDASVDDPSRDTGAERSAQVRGDPTSEVIPESSTPAPVSTAVPGTASPAVVQLTPRVRLHPDREADGESCRSATRAHAVFVRVPLLRRRRRWLRRRLRHPERLRLNPRWPSGHR